ncbi:DUF6468 domain-containing protein [Pararhodospirillum oryzae]|uniref:DUF6468 domain-containing protein n=1 Tax=Pararhodospirillum oryzae TaxID=478448 RepID=A0A512H8Q0_9PROT|nr:DUF6468 domain-containing protein [Pararhodospirillum oryzae]GEO81798.1 hypothetical protein ROR02_19290 [Pararhodospirillum oryzae]
MPLQLLLDGTIIVLLLVFIGYAVLLSRQLKDLRRNRDEMARIITTFNEATARAEAGIPRLRKTAEEAGRALDDSVSKARTLRDDLAYMVERADGMATRLETAVRSARGGEGKPAARDPVRPDPRAVDARAVEAHVDLRTTDRLDGAASDYDDRLAQARPRPRPARADGRGSALPAPLPVRGYEDDEEPLDLDLEVEDERSEAERELLRALQSVR